MVIVSSSPLQFVQKYIKFQKKLYKNDPYFVAPIVKEVTDRLDSKKSPILIDGKVQCWTVEEKGKILATFVTARDFKREKEKKILRGIFGYLEFEENLTVFTTIIEKIRSWMEEEKLDLVVGPYNLDYEDSYGILDKGFNEIPAVLCGHSKPYYSNYFQKLQIKTVKEPMIALKLFLDDDLGKRFDKYQSLIQRIRKNNSFIIRGADFNQWNEEIDKIRSLINKTLQHFPDFGEWSREILEENLKPFRQLANPQHILMAEDKGQLVGWFPAVPNINEKLHGCNGLKYPWNWVKFLLRLKSKYTSASIKSLLIHPDYWNSGLSLLMFYELYLRLEKEYSWIDLSLTGKDNPHTPSIAKKFGAEIYKEYLVYRISAE